MKKDFCGFLNTIGNSTTTNNIIVTFIDGKEAEYTTNILNDLKSDPTVSHIIDSETGELLYMKEVSKPVKPTKSTMRKFFEDKTAKLDWKLPDGKWIDLGNDTKVFVENGKVIRAMSDGSPAGVYRWDKRLNCRTNVLPCKYETFRKAYREDRYTIQ